jgi:hypothetical protein
MLVSLPYPTSLERWDLLDDPTDFVLSAVRAGFHH